MVELYATMVESTEKEEGGTLKLFKNKYFLVAMVASFFYIWIHWGSELVLKWVNWNPNYGMGVYQSGWFKLGGQQISTFWLRKDDLTKLGLLSWVPLFVSLIPHEIGFMTLQSFDVLYGFLAGWLILWVIWPIIGTSMGRLPAYTSGKNANTCYTYVIGGDTGGLTMYMLWMGVAVGMALYPLWQHRRTMFDIMTSLVRKPSEALEKESPIPYRYIWIALLLSALAWLGIIAAVNVNVMAVALYIIIGMIAIVGWVKMYADTGGFMGAFWGHAHAAFWPGVVGAMILTALGVDSTPSATNVHTYWFLNSYFEEFFGIVFAVGCVAVLFWQVAKRTKTTTKSASNYTIFAFAVSIILAVVLMLGTLAFIATPYYRIERWGYERMGGRMFSRYISYINGKTFAAGVNTRWVSAVGPNVGLLLVGVVIAFAVPMIRSKIPLAALSVSGMLMGMIWGWIWGITAIVALLIKILSIKLGGIRFHDSKIKPIMVGLVVGAFLAYIWVYLFGGTIMDMWWFYGLYHGYWVTPW
jgi:hypothetical protein